MRAQQMPPNRPPSGEAGLLRWRMAGAGRVGGCVAPLDEYHPPRSGFAGFRFRGHCQVVSVEGGWTSSWPRKCDSVPAVRRQR